MKADPQEVERWLEWAGQRLIAMPGARVGPSESTGWWPDYSQDRFEILQFRAGISLRIAAPGPHEIGLMEEILLLPGLIGRNDVEHDCNVRKIVRWRTLLHPITERHLWNWPRIAEKHGKSIPTVRRWYTDGLVRICRRMQDQQAQELQKKFRLTVGER